MFDQSTEEVERTGTSGRSGIQVAMDDTPRGDTRDTGSTDLPGLEIIDDKTAAAQKAEGFGQFLDGQLMAESNEKKPELKTKYDNATLNDAVEASIANKVPMVVHIGAPWCGPCRTMEKDVWPTVEKELKGKAAFVHIDGQLLEDEGTGGEHAKSLMKGVENYPTIKVVQPYRDEKGNVQFKPINVIQPVLDKNNNPVRDRNNNIVMGPSEKAAGGQTLAQVRELLKDIYPKKKN